MGMDMSKYYKLDKQEFNSLVQIKARIFIGNNLVFYIINTKDWTGYILCEVYDDICRQFKVSIEDKSTIKRISFKTPDNFDIEEFKLHPGEIFRPTDASKEDAYEIFPDGKFVYRRRDELNIERELIKILRDYCTTKYAEEIERDKKEINKRETEEFIKKLQVIPFVEVYDTSLKEVVGYVCVEKSTMVRMIGAADYSAQLRFSASDINRLSYGLNITTRVEVEPNLVYKVGKEDSKVIRNYGQILYNNVAIRVLFTQNRDGLCSNIPLKYQSNLDVTSNDSFEYTNINDLRAEMEKMRLSGNKWFHNNGETFIKEPKRVERRKLDNRPRNKYGLIDMFRRDE